MGQFHVILVMPSYGLIPVPPHLRHLTILSPFLRVPFPSQFLHVCFFSLALSHMECSKVAHRSLSTLFKRLHAESYHRPNDRSVTVLDTFAMRPLRMLDSVDRWSLEIAPLVSFTPN